jgi:hypothetical protein
VVLFAVIGGAGVGDLVVEECFDRSSETPGEGSACFGVEFAMEVEHAGVLVKPPPQLNVAALPFEPGDAIIGRELSGALLQ